jgi:hypothetical protein
MTTTTAAPALSRTERAEMCARVDFLAMLAADGVEVMRRGNRYLCKMRPDERTPSCNLWPPGSGCRGAAGWTWHDYGSGANGDALGYLVDVRGVPFVEAVDMLAHAAGMRRAEKGPHLPDTGRKAAKLAPLSTAPGNERLGAVLDENEQAGAVLGFLLALMEADRDTVARGDEYLDGRGVMPKSWPRGVAYHLDPDAARTVARELAADRHAENYAAAGLLRLDKGKPPRLAWRGPCVLLACRDGRETWETWPLYLVARRLDFKPGDKVGKYLNQSCQGGAMRWAFNLPSVYAAAGRLPRWPWKPTRRGCLLVEGPTDALGACRLGWPAVALLNRPHARGWTDRAGGAVRMLTPHLAALRDVAPVAVVPDHDANEAKGEAMALGLVAWLRGEGVAADVKTLAELWPGLPPDVKDLADLAKKEAGDA